LTVGEGLTGRWFSNVPLAESGGTRISVGFPGGILDRTLEIEWLDTNVLEQKLPLSLRVGDSLKLKAVPPLEAVSTGILSVDGVELGNGDLSTARVFTFTEAGRHTVSAELKSETGTLSASMDVIVYGADFGSAFSVAGATSRKWKLPNVPRALLLESDPYLSLTEQDGGEPRQVLVTSLKDSSDYQRVIARLPNAGPIVAATAVNTFRIIAAAKALDAHMVNVLPDGTRVIQMGIAIDGPIPADLSIWLEMYVTDAVFANGDTFHHLTAADFDEFGIARITIYKAPGGNIAAICHWIRPYAEDPTEDRTEDPAEEPTGDTAE
jgi:hypothetical protein